MKERRKMVRRQADRELFGLIERKTGLKPAAFLGRRKRRRVIRHICHAKFVLQSEQDRSRLDPTQVSARRELDCRILDLNEDGAMVFADCELSVGHRGRFVIRLFDDRTEAIEATAEVRWAQRKEAKSGFAMGLQLSDISAASRERLKEFLVKLDETLGL